MVSAFTVAEMIVLRCGYVFYFARMSEIDEDFLARILMRVNYCFAISTSLIRIHMQEYLINDHYIYFVSSGSKDIFCEHCLTVRRA